MLEATTLIEIISECPITLAGLVGKTQQSWADVASTLDPLLEAGIIKEYDPSPEALPIYYYNG